ncbi:SRPBCC family protein [Pseudoduganella sp. OTU4001]|uniref:SRPBCC family protein n=1 Tax=Pseudoduganella sp. OTU4001 TaxID=3043854 RepID=UPI00313E5E73
MSDFSAPNEIRIIRTYDAPVQAVWDAWTDPAQVAQWWGPRGFTLTTHSKDLRVGGKWRYTMHGPDGKDWPNVTLYHVVEPLRKLVYDHGGTDDTPPLFKVTVLFEEVDGKTRMDMTMGLADAETARQTRAFIKQAGGDSTWDRLAEYLGKRLADEDKFVINRSFEAPREVVFDMWTNPEHLARWLPPTGMEMRFMHADIRTGGKSFFSMGNEAFTLHGRAQYELIRRPDLLVYTQQFCDESENIARHPMLPVWPESMRVTVAFAAEAENRTRVTVTTDIAGKATAEEVAAFVAHRASMTMGWSVSFDKLEAALAG